MVEQHETGIRSDGVEDTMAPEGAARLAAVLDVAPAPIAGHELPMLWHWAYFREPATQSSLGADGHVQRSDVLAERLPRRMAASGMITRFAPLLIGHWSTHAARLRTPRGHREERPLGAARFRQLAPRHRAGRRRRSRGAADGRLPRCCGACRRREEAPAPPEADALLRCEVRFGPTMLFRYSAVTWNAHRIHYDLDYATKVEGYPGLVVHGPLLATLLARDATGELGELGMVKYRARAPVFIEDPVQIFVRAREGGGLALDARKVNGTVAMTLLAASAR